VIAKLIEQLLTELGQDPQRDGLERTPERVEKALRYLTSGYGQDPRAVLNDALFVEDYDEMVVVKDIDFFSLCVPGRQLVNAVGGAKRARAVRLGDRLWTLHQGFLKETEVSKVTARKTREIVEVTTTAGRFRVTPDHPVMTESGWREAQELTPGTNIEWINSRSLCREPHDLKPGYALGYVIGAVGADGSIQDGRRVNVTVRNARFAEKYRAMLAAAIPSLSPAVERVIVPSSFVGHPVEMFRVRTVSRSFAEKLCRWFSIDERGARSKTKTFNFPRVVTSSRTMMQGFLDGYCDGDGYEVGSGGRFIISSNRTFLAELGEYLQTPVAEQRGSGWCGRVYVSRRRDQAGWYGKHGFRQHSEFYVPIDSTFASVVGTRCLPRAKKTHTVYSYKCDPYQTLLIGGHLSHKC